MINLKQYVTDGLTNIVNSLTNARAVNAQYTHSTSTALSYDVLRSVYKTGIGSRIVDIKCGYTLNDTLQFESESAEDFYATKLRHKIKDAVRWMFVYGRSIIVLHSVGDKLDQPLTGNINADKVLFSVFGGDEVNAAQVSMDLQSERYLKPEFYQVNGSMIHYSRVVDFVYRLPPVREISRYNYGGISEFETIYEQVLGDGVIQRATPRIVDKASTMFYRVVGFKEKMAMKQDSQIINYFSMMENLRGIWGAGLIDADDDVEVVSQSITGLADIDNLGLRRLAMVTGIPLNVLVGESVRGLNSSGKQERATLQDTIETIQSEYLLTPINQLFALLGLGAVKFKENQGESANERATYDGLVIDNAVKLAALGEDHRAYLADRGIISDDDLAVEPDGDENNDEDDLDDEQTASR